MLKKRIIPIQLLLNNRLVKTIKFGEYRDVGDPVTSSKVYDSQYADELIVLNINRGTSSVECLLSVLKEVSKVCFMPLSCGGGIRSLQDASLLIKAGADKIVLNSICYQDISVVNSIANKYGSQAIIVCVDVMKSDITGEYNLYSHCGEKKEQRGLIQHIQLCVQSGCGEILIQSIDQDGMMNGFDLELVKKVTMSVGVPVIACGGSGSYSHLKDVFLQTETDAVACGSIFNFSDSNLMRAKAYLTNYGLNFKAV